MSFDPGSWVVQLVGLLLEQWKTSEVRARRKHRKALQRLVSDAGDEAERRALEAASKRPGWGGRLESEAFGEVLLGDDEDALAALRRVAVDASAMPRDRRWWPGSVDDRLAGLTADEAAPARVWLDELPEALRAGFQGELGEPNSPLGDLASVTHLRDALERVAPAQMWPSLRERRRQVEAYLVEVLERAAARPVHGGHGVARVHQPVRVRWPDGDSEGLEVAGETTGGQGGLGDGDLYLPKGADADATASSAARLWGEAREDWRQISVLGEPGYGKSWLLSEEALHAGESALRQCRAGVEPDDLALPVRVRLDAVAARLDSDRGVEAAVVAALADTYQVSEGLQAWMVDMLTGRPSPWLMLLDGLDEVPDQPREALLVRLREWKPACRVVLTSRLIGYPAWGISRHGDWGEVELVPFGEQEVTGFVGQWFGLSEADAAALTESLFSRAWLAGMVRVPLLLSLVCVLLSDPDERTAPPAAIPATQLRQRIAGLPAHRAGLYAQVVRHFLHQGHREAPGVDDTHVDTVISQASAIAWLYSTARSGWAERLTTPQIKDEAGEILTETQTDSALRMLREQGLLVADGRSQDLTAYRFLHRTFHEYLTAHYLANLPDDGWRQHVRERLWFDPDGQQVIVLLAGILDDPTPLLDELTSQDPDPFEHALALAVRAAAELPARQRSRAGPVFDNALSYLTVPGSEIPQALHAAAAMGDPNLITRLVRRLDDKHLEVRAEATRALRGTTDGEALAALAGRLNDDHPEVRRQAAWALEGTTDREALAALAGRLNDDHPEVRWEAIRALRGTTDGEVLVTFTALLNDKHPEVRRQAARALEGTTDGEALAALTALLNDKHPEVRRQAAWTLEGTTDGEALAALTALLDDDHPEVRKEAARALRSATDREALAALAGRLDDDHPEVHRAAARALRGTTDGEALVALIDRLNDDHSEVRKEAAVALRGTTDGEALVALIDRLNDDHSEVRKEAARALRGTTDGEALAALTALLNDDHPEVRRQAAWALEGTTDGEALAALIDRLNDDHPEVRRSAAVALRGTTDREALAALAGRLNDDHPEVRREAAALVGPRVITDAEALAALIDRLNDDHPEVRRQAVALVGLRVITDAEALAPLIDRLNDDHPEVRKEATRALGRTTDVEAAALLIGGLNDDHPGVRSAAVTALRGTTDAEALAALIGRLNDDHPEVRRAVARALRDEREPGRCRQVIDFLSAMDSFAGRSLALRLLASMISPAHRHARDKNDLRRQVHATVLRIRSQR